MLVLWCLFWGVVWCFGGVVVEVFFVFGVVSGTLGCWSTGAALVYWGCVGLLGLLVYWGCARLLGLYWSTGAIGLLGLCWSTGAVGLLGLLVYWGC